MVKVRAQPAHSNGQTKGVGVNRAGDALLYPDGTRHTFLEEGTDERGEYLLIEHVHPRPGPLAGSHWHPVVMETFSVKEGKMRFRVDGQELMLGPGESITIRPDQMHRFWNVGEERLVAVEEVRPPGRHWKMFELMHRLHCAGKTNEQDIP